MFSSAMQTPALASEFLECMLPGVHIRKVEYIQPNEDGSETVTDLPVAEQASDVASGTAAAPDSPQGKVTTEVQKTLTGYFGYRGVRLDVYVEEEKADFNVEMQVTIVPALPQRSRLNQSHMDISQIQRGRHYDELRPSIVIFICTWDPFGKDLYRYSFRNMCYEEPDLALNDGAYKLFFNTTGHKGDISPRLKELLEYMNDPKNYDVANSDNDLICKLDSAVNNAKASRE